MFKKTRVKLAAWYALSLFVVSVAFSLVIYQALNTEIDRFAESQRLRLERRLRQEGFFMPFSAPGVLEPPLIDPDIITDIKFRLRLVLLLINLGLLAAAGGLGYILSGKTLQPIQQMVTEQNRFISDASHEIKTPLTSLKSAFEVYLRGRKPRLAEAATVIRESLGEVDKLQALSENLLELAQYHQPNLSYNFQKISLTSTINQVLAQFKPRFLLKKLKLTTNLADPIYLLADKDSFIRLLTLLLDNAVKYTKSGGSLSITTSTVDHQVKIMIKDSGIGISHKDLPHIFDRFYRADSARTKTGAGGFGLGLAIAADIIKRHHGMIKVSSILHEGSEFTLILPQTQKEL